MRLCVGTEERPCEGPRGGSICRPERPPRNPSSSTLSTSFSLQDCEKINVCSLSRPVCGILLWQPEQTNTLLTIRSLANPMGIISGFPVLHGKNMTLWDQYPSLWHPAFNHLDGSQPHSPSQSPGCMVPPICTALHKFQIL